MNYPNSKLNTLNWQVLKVVETESTTQKDLSIPIIIEELKRLSEIGHSPIEDKESSSLEA